MMLAYVYRLMVFLLLIGVTTAVAQERKKKPESISTEPKLATATIKMGDGATIEINGTITFRLAEVNSDDSLTGHLEYTIADDSRKEVAKAVGKPVSEIPASLAIKNVVIFFERDAKCPDLRINLLSLDREIALGRMRFNRLDLTIRESQQELSKLLCWYARPHREKGGVYRKINRILKGEKEEQ